MLEIIIVIVSCFLVLIKETIQVHKEELRSFLLKLTTIKVKLGFLQLINFCELHKMHCSSSSKD